MNYYNLKGKLISFVILLTIFFIGGFQPLFADSTSPSNLSDQSQTSISQDTTVPLRGHGNAWRQWWTMLQSQSLFCTKNQRRPYCRNFHHNNKPLTKSSLFTTSNMTLPIVTLLGSATVNLNIGDTYTEAGATVTDVADASVSVVVTGSVDTSTTGTYTIHYNATDKVGNQAKEVTRTVIITAPIVPITPDLTTIPVSTSSLTSTSPAPVSDPNTSSISTLPPTTSTDPTTSPASTSTPSTSDSDSSTVSPTSTISTN